MSTLKPISPIRVMIVDRQPLLRAGLQALLASQRNIEVSGTAGTAAEAIQLISIHRPGVVVLDPRLPDLGGIELIEQLHAAEPDSALLLLLGDEEVAASQVFLHMGVRGCLRKSTTYEDLVAALRMLARGWTVHNADLRAEGGHTECLTAREIEVLEHIAAGRRNHEIAAQLVVSTRTVEFHISHILSKLAARSRTEALQKAIRQGIITLHEERAA